MSKLIHIDKIPTTQQAAFTAKVKQVAANLGVQPEWLMQVMYAESRVNPQAKNVQGGRLIAAGLIQWTKASGYPGAPESVLSRTALQQLDMVQQYFAPYRGKMKSYFDVYLATFFPAAVGKPDNYIFQTSRYSAALIASQNPAVNINKDKQITMAEFKQYVFNSVPKAVRNIVFTTAASSGAAIVIAVAAFFF